MGRKVIFMRCQRCKCKIERNSNAQKYCKECSIIHKREYNRLLLMRKRNLGTSDFYGTPKKDFNAEKIECEKEIKKLGIKRQFS